MTNRYKSVFDIIGPVMVGPSSSHTAGAVAIGRAGYKLLAVPRVKLPFIITTLSPKLTVVMEQTMLLRQVF